MSIEKEGESTTRFWSTVAVRFSVEAMTGATYYPHEHGSLSNNKTLPENDSIFLVDKYLLNKKFPIKQNSQIFAIGSLMYLCPNRESLESVLSIKSSALSTETSLSLGDIEKVGAKPMAMVMADLDCPNSRENLFKIETVLDRNYQGIGWSIFETNNSFHLIFDQFDIPENIPTHFGKLINAFAQLEPEDRRVYFEKIGKDLIYFYDNPEKIRQICEQLKTEICHYDEPDSAGIKFIVDLRWVAHSLEELLNFLETGKGSFAYLRIIPKSTEKPDLKLVAISRIHKLLNGKIVSYDLDD